MKMPSNIQYVTDEQGNRTAVIIPIKVWQKLMKELKTFSQYQAMKKQLTDAFLDVKAMQSGKKEKVTLKEFLSEL